MQAFEAFFHQLSYALDDASGGIDVGIGWSWWRE